MVWLMREFLKNPQIQKFKNLNTLPLFITVTCEFSRFDNHLRDTAGEKLFLNKNGGAVSMITTSRNIYISNGAIFNKKLNKHLLEFGNKNLSIAQNLMVTKNLSRTQQKYFIFLFWRPSYETCYSKSKYKVNQKLIRKQFLKV